MKRFNAAAGGLLAASLRLTACLLASALAGCGSPTTGSTSAGAPKGQPVVVGAIVSTTGPASALGEQEAKALSLMQTQVNAQGGVLRRPLKIVVEMTRATPTKR